MSVDELTDRADKPLGVPARAVPLSPDAASSAPTPSFGIMSFGIKTFRIPQEFGDGLARDFRRFAVRDVIAPGNDMRADRAGHVSQDGLDLGE
jgi:hypothetical protein